MTDEKTHKELMDEAATGDHEAVARFEAARAAQIARVARELREAYAEDVGYGFTLTVHLADGTLGNLLAPEHPALRYLTARVIAEDFRAQALAALGELLENIETADAGN